MNYLSGQIRNAGFRIAVAVCAALGGTSLSAGSLPPGYKYEVFLGRTGKTTQPYALNNNGKILGVDEVGHYIYDGMTYTDVPGPTGTGRFGYSDLNDAELLAGLHSVASSIDLPAIFDGSTILETISLPENTMGGLRSINNLNQVVGSYRTELSGPSTSFFYDGTQMHEVAYPGAERTDISRVNDSGEMVGMYFTEATGDLPHAFRGTLGNLSHVDVQFAGPTTSGPTIRINNVGQIAATIQEGGGYFNRGLVIDGEKRHMVNFPGSSQTRLFDINDAGQLIGRATFRSNEPDQTFIATPVEPFPIGVFSEARAGGSSAVHANITEPVRGSLGMNFDGTVYVEADALTPGSLEMAKALLLGASHDIQGSDGTLDAIVPITQDEQQNLLDYIEGGGGAIIVLHGESDFAATNASFLEIFGMEFQEHEGGTDWLTVPEPGMHLVTDGPFGLADQKSNFGGAGWFTDLGPYAKGLGTLDANGETALAVIDPGALGPGSGGVVIFGSISPMVFRGGSEETLLLNSMHFVTAPEPATGVLLLLGCSGLLIGRRRP